MLTYLPIEDKSVTKLYKPPNMKSILSSMSGYNSIKLPRNDSKLTHKSVDVLNTQPIT